VKINVFLWISFSFVLLSADAMSFGMPEADITIQVIDENGQPIEDATVRMAFEQGTDLIRQRPKSKKVEGKTGKDGVFRSKKDTTGYVGIGIKKIGYYESHIVQRFWHSDPNLKKQDEWKSTQQTILKKIENPVPMYAKKIFWKRVPIGETTGFDLEIGDFVQPFGNGKVSDFVFNFKGTRIASDNREEHLSVTFSNKGDGIQEFIISPDDHSAFKSPKLAPIDGYKERLEFSVLTYPGKAVERKGTREDQNFVFRVRTKLDEQGYVIQANYGKIYGPIEYGFSGEEGMISFKFDYYFNPDHTRNLEFDLKRNLFRYLDGSKIFEAPCDAP